MKADYKKYIPDLCKMQDQFVVLLWKMGLGKLFNYLPKVFGHTMVIGLQGGGAGNGSLTPVNYYSEGEFIYCTYIFKEKPDWYLDVIANPQVEIWLPGGWYTGKAEIVGDEGERTVLLYKILETSGVFVPLWLGMNFQTIDAETFHEATADYRVLRISRQSPRTGADGPASLAWLWPLIFVFLLLRGRRRK